MLQYPKPQVPYSGYSDLYFATAGQVRSWAVLAGRDRGELTAGPRRLTFRGMDVEVHCANVSAVTLVRKAFPWVTLLAIAVAAAILIYVNSPVPFTWRQPPVYAVLIVLSVACLIQSRERWVEVVYSEGERERRAYFRRAGLFAWWLGTARTRQLYRDLRRTVLLDGAAASGTSESDN